MIRPSTTSLYLSAAVLVSIALDEGYSSKAIIPVPGDVPTIGFGTTGGVKRGDSITPERALMRLLADADKFSMGVKQCANVPLYQYEFDAYVSLSYNIGIGAFCSSTLVKQLHLYNYEAACKEILRWDKFQGVPLKGLTNRRQREYARCVGNV